MQPPRLTDLDFKSASRWRGVRRRRRFGGKRTVLALTVAAAGALLAAMTTGGVDDFPTETVDLIGSAADNMPKASREPEQRVSLPVTLPDVDDARSVSETGVTTAVDMAQPSPDAAKPVADTQSEGGAVLTAAAFGPMSLLQGAVSTAKREEAVPRPDEKETGATTADADAWRGPQAWMEPFVPFFEGQSVDALVAAMAAAAAPPEEDFERVEVRRGDSLAAIFSRMGLSAAELHRVVNADEQAAGLTRIFPGDEILFQLSDEGGLAALRYKLDDTRTLIIDRTDDDDFQVSVHEEVLETRTLHATGVIDRSLYLSARDAGLSNRHIMELMSIFEWQVDFNRDIRGGDAFSVVYEADFLNDRKVRDGRIVAASFINRGRRHEAVFYEDAAGNRGYFNADGENMRKAFIRRPVQSARISSGFDRNRMHPVLGVRRPHLGTDFAAPTGTPIMAAGNGRVVQIGRNGGYGQSVVIQHTNQIRTLYGHMSRYASGLRNGSRVEQGEIIGYVGATGLATGPHLHYEFLVNGAHQNPMKVSLPNGDPVPEEHLAEFQASTADRLALLEEVTETQLALLDDD